MVMLELMKTLAAKAEPPFKVATMNDRRAAVLGDGGVGRLLGTALFFFFFFFFFRVCVKLLSHLQGCCVFLGFYRVNLGFSNDFL